MTRDPLDRYYTPLLLAEACVAATIGDAPPQPVIEPSVGGGSFARALTRRGHSVIGVDVDPHCTGRALCEFRHLDFLDFADISTGAEWVIGNPPYRDAERHMRHALEVSGRHVVFLLRASFLASSTRCEDLWTWAPLRHVFHVYPRPSFTQDGKTDGAEYALFWLDKARSRGTDPRLSWLKWNAGAEEEARLEVYGQASLFGGE